jgi:hypothetical protein
MAPQASKKCGLLLPDHQQIGCSESNSLYSEQIPAHASVIVLLRTIPGLEKELAHVVNAFDPWARDRGTYYTLQWKARKGATSDPSFKETQMPLSANNS